MNKVKLILLILLLFGCQEQSTQLVFKKQTSNNRKILKIAAVDSESYAALHNPDILRFSPLMGLFVFDRADKVVYNLEITDTEDQVKIPLSKKISTGFGPGESINITDMFVSDSVVILCDPQISRIIVWNLKIDTLSTYKVPMRPYRIIALQKSTVIYCPESYPVQKISTFNLTTGDTSIAVSFIPSFKYPETNIYYGSHFIQLDNSHFLQGFTRLGLMLLYNHFIPYKGIQTIDGRQQPKVFNKKFAQSVRITYVDHAALLTCSVLSSSENRIAVLSYNPVQKKEYIDLYDAQDLEYQYSIEPKGTGNQVCLVSNSILYVLNYNTLYTYHLRNLD